MSQRAKRSVLPHETAKIVLTDGGLETTLIFLEGFELPCFASFDLLKDEVGIEALRNYFRKYLEIASVNGFGFILESPTWRANPDWVEKAGYSKRDTKKLNAQAIALMAEMRKEFAGRVDPIMISGCVGPRGDGYSADSIMKIGSAENYHSEQILAFSMANVDMVSAITMTHVEEAIGIANAAAKLELPVVISFTVETDGKLPSGMSLKEAIRQVDRYAKVQPIYYMINCAHPTHFADMLMSGKEDGWTKRIKGIRANASPKSHAELDESTELDRGNLDDFRNGHAGLNKAFPQINVYGGCCGTDHEHILEIVKAVNA